MAEWSWHQAGDLRVKGSNPSRGRTPRAPTQTPLATLDPGLPQNAQKMISRQDLKASN